MANEKKVKQVIIFREDLLKGSKKINKGKFSAQCCHASLGSLLKEFTVNEDESGVSYECHFEKNSILDKWLNGIFTKVCLSVENEEQLVELYNRIKNESPIIPCVLIEDQGLTEFHGVKTKTCVGVGPFWSDDIDQFTGNLKLL